MKIKIYVSRKASDPVNRSYDVGFEMNGCRTEENPIVVNIGNHI